jgi:hypothetical protein
MCIARYHTQIVCRFKPNHLVPETLSVRADWCELGASQSYLLEQKRNCASVPSTCLWLYFGLCFVTLEPCVCPVDRSQSLSTRVVVFTQNAVFQSLVTTCRLCEWNVRIRVVRCLAAMLSVPQAAVLPLCSPFDLLHLSQRCVVFILKVSEHV